MCYYIRQVLSCIAYHMKGGLYMPRKDLIRLKNISFIVTFVLCLIVAFFMARTLDMRFTAKESNAYMRYILYKEPFPFCRFRDFEFCAAGLLISSLALLCSAISLLVLRKKEKTKESEQSES